MERSPQKLGLILLILVGMSSCLIASRINLQDYEDVSKDASYGNACVVRSYRDDLLLQQGNGTLCEHKGIKFILTTTEIISGNRYTILFDGKDESVVTFPETLDLTYRYGYKRSKIAISFMDIYPPQITPATIDQSSDLTHTLTQTHVVGYGHTLLPKSKGDLVFFDANRESLDYLSKRILVPFNPSPVRQTISGINVVNPDLKSITGHCSEVLQGCELPLPPGIMGAAIRTQEGNVAGVALGSIPYWRTDTYLELYPIQYRLLHMASDLVKNIKNKFSFSTLAVGALISQATFTYSPALGIASYCIMGAGAWLSHRLPALAETWGHYTFPAGSENYGLQLLPWMTALEEKLRSHHQKQKMARLTCLNH